MNKPLSTAIGVFWICLHAVAAGNPVYNPVYALQSTSADAFKQSSNAPDTGTKPHSPRKASIYSAVLPGLGQAYNRKYWKIPLVYTALGTTGYLYYFNRKEMMVRQNALKLMLDGDSLTQPADEFANIPINILRKQRNNYRTNADLNLILFSGFYVLNIIDAVVDAHFYKFNIDKPLAARREKRWHLYSSHIGNMPAAGFSWRF